MGKKQVLKPKGTYKFHKKLLELRTETGLSQIKLAKLAGMSLRQYHRLESGTSDPSMTTMIKLVRALNTDIQTLFEADIKGVQ